MTGAWRPKHVDLPCRNKTCIVLHLVGVSFDLYRDARKHKIKIYIVLRKSEALWLLQRRLIIKDDDHRADCDCDDLESCDVILNFYFCNSLFLHRREFDEPKSPWKENRRSFSHCHSEFDGLTDDWIVKVWFIPSAFSFLPSLLPQTA